MRKYLLILSLLVSLAMTSCTGDKAIEKPNNELNPESSQENIEPASQASSDKLAIKKPGFTRETYPKVDGSTATIPLSEAVAANILNLTKDEAPNFIKHNTTHSAYENLIKGKADIILVTEPSEEELKLARDAKVDLDIIPIVKEGFVFLVNSKNPVSSLMSKQIQDIYQGKIKNWKEVGGEDKKITAYQRDANSGSQTLMEQKVMKGLKMEASPQTVVFEMSGLIEKIANYDNSDTALGYSVYYYAKTMYNKDTIKFVAVNGVKPDNVTISNGSYPFSSAYYAVIKKSESSDSNSRRLIQWLLSDEGQKLAEASGYVPLSTR